MISSIESRQDTGESKRPVLFFTLDKDHTVHDYAQMDRFFGENDIFQNGRTCGNILPMDNPDIQNALENAFTGNPSQVRFSLKNGHGEYHYDLYCFPFFGPDKSSIGCFLADRCLDEDAARKLKEKIDRLDIINQAVRAFAETNNLTEILKIILLAVTSGPGLGFNRGFILLTDESRKYLHGCLATGPSSAEEAGKIWQSLSRKPLSLAEMLRMYRANDGITDTFVNQVVTSLRVPLAENSNFLTKAFKERRALSIDQDSELNDAETDLKSKFGSQSLAVAPLISRENWLGVIIADNYITSKPIGTNDLKLLEILARYASDAIENTHLYGRLQRKIARLKEANEKIIRTRENLIRAEKFSSISKMALEVAHEIRNPLTIIGGHANARLRKIDREDENRKTLGIISKQAARIENTLNRFTSVISLSEKDEGNYKLAELVFESLRTLCSVDNEDMPSVKIDKEMKNRSIFIDQGMFYKAMMVILREASLVAEGLSNVLIEIKKQENLALIYLRGKDDNKTFAEKFFYSIRTGKAESAKREMTLSVEILRYYGGDLGFGSTEDYYGWVTVEFPLAKEEK